MLSFNSTLSTPRLSRMCFYCKRLTDAPSLPGYRVHGGPRNVRCLCTLVKKGLTFVKHTLHNIKIERALIVRIATKERKQHLPTKRLYESIAEKSEIQSSHPQSQHRGGHSTR
ncbi:hypothetical protein HPB48_000960 [Haemaphysalis longicornis]|uniref:Uncharacterized protein n=1 Tax=Haemaphysalis longicornis TaxID=44386 RepID=A0A9J6GJH9_HAELO|nr:hypothetical protein HPB48_000960 [Haemaphysalis longicornis]